MTTAALAGSTGFVGSNILSILVASSSFSSVYAYTRRDLPNPTASTKIFPVQSTSTDTWPAQFPREAHPKIFFSALGTTKAAAGGIEQQRAVDLDLAYSVAQAAKDADVEVYVLISSVGASATSRAPYLKMKGELEDKVKALGFKHTVIIRPGIIIGDRGSSHSVFEAGLRGFANALKKASPALTNSWGQDAATIARAAVKAGEACVKGEKEAGVWEIAQGEIVRLGKE